MSIGFKVTTDTTIESLRICIYVDQNIEKIISLLVKDVFGRAETIKKYEEIYQKVCVSENLHKNKLIKSYLKHRITFTISNGFNYFFYLNY